MGLQEEFYSGGKRALMHLSPDGGVNDYGAVFNHMMLIFLIAEKRRVNLQGKNSIIFVNNDF